MKQVIKNLYTLKGGEAQERVNEVRTLLGLGTTSDSTEFVEHAMATAVNDFLVASGSGVFVKKTLAQTKTILGLDEIVVGTSGAKYTLASATSRSVSSYTTSSFATAGTISSVTVNQTMTGASATNSAEVAQFVLTTAVKLGQWANAVVGKVDMTTAGYSAGIVGAVCAEVDFPSGGITGGSGQYHCFEAELNLAGATGGVPMSFLNMNVWGANKTEFDTYGYIFDIQGVADHATTKVFQASNNTTTHALRIRINDTAYYILLSDTSD
jgi:hypothetical protein